MKQQQFAACAAALAFAALPAWAGDGATITQFYGSANVVAVEQIATGGNNAVQVFQNEYGYEGNGNLVQVTQLGVDASRADIHQSGNGNQYTIRQTGGANLQVSVNADYWLGDTNGDYNTILVDQSGFDSSVRVNQLFGSNNHIDILQQGGANVAEVVQAGDGHQASIWQSGTNLQALIEQRGGYGNVATIRQGY